MLIAQKKKRLRIRACAVQFLPFRHPERKRQDGPPAALLESPKKIRSGISILPCVLKQTWSDPQIWAQHVPPVLQTIRKRHRLREVGLKVFTRAMWKQHPSTPPP
ncbi:hypothetical protein PDJAM_G00098730 [Pangasius djambal]|uniref:Uncharacterized protein n=1 Tax=Pangasius djambal TaxID=1691987 RepID=A0ACC5Z7S8_9TELE|nr:hypothetical protein [Pangasius djambal]